MARKPRKCDARQPLRRIPLSILRSGIHPDNLEAQAVAAKYGVPHGIIEISEANVDTVAMAYMNGEASLFWLPRFLDYIRSKAPVDSWHSEVMLFRLGDPETGAELRALAMPEEVAMVREYLAWYRNHPGYPGRAQHWDRAVALWD